MHTAIPVSYTHLDVYKRQDYDHVMEFVKRQIPEKNKLMILDIKDYLGKTLAGYARAYLILMLITFVELSVGLLALLSLIHISRICLHLVCRQ